MPELFSASLLENIREGIGDVWGAVWWIVLPVLTAFFFFQAWVFYIRYRFITRIQWVLLEIKIPKNVMTTPKAMEQIFAVAHGPYSYGLRFLEKYWEGIVEYWMSFELVGRAGEIHFYLRAPRQFRNLMESAIYGQYPEAEITESGTDYVKEMPKVVPTKTHDLWGCEYILRGPDPLPIRTYVDFEEQVEERRIDPLAPIFEAMSKLKEDEQIWLQALVRPTGDAWRKEGEKMVNEISGKVEKGKGGGYSVFDHLGDLFRGIFTAPFEPPTFGGPAPQEKEKISFRMLLLTPGEQEVVKAIDRKTAKLGFETTIRFIYIDRRDAFSKDNVAAVMGTLRQFSTQNCNLLRPNKKTMTAAIHGLWKPLRYRWRKRVLFERYRDLIFGPKKSILNIEELATVYHFPITQVKAPMLERIESRRGGPPPSLPVE